VVKRLLVEEGVSIARELYAAFWSTAGAARGGHGFGRRWDGESKEVAAHTPEAIVKEHVDPALGLAPFQARKLFLRAWPDRHRGPQRTSFLQKLYQAFVALDASLVEVNPLWSPARARAGASIAR